MDTPADQIQAALRAVTFDILSPFNGPFKWINSA